MANIFTSLTSKVTSGAGTVVKTVGNGIAIVLAFINMVFLLLVVAVAAIPTGAFNTEEATETIDVTPTDNRPMTADEWKHRNLVQAKAKLRDEITRRADLEIKDPDELEIIERYSPISNYKDAVKTAQAEVDKC